MSMPTTKPPARAGSAALGLLFALGAALPAASCNDGRAASAAADKVGFDQARAWTDLSRLVALGPRPAGTPALEAARKLIEEELRQAGLTPVRETFTEKTPIGDVEFANVYADLAARTPDAERVILCTHFDTKLTDKRFPQPFVGANDAGSGTAVLLELARVLARGGPRDLAYRILFLDGEEALLWDWHEAQQKGLPPDHTYGSRHHAAKLVANGEAHKVRACILLDMVGDKDLKIFRDRYSDRRLLEIVSAAARRIGLSKHVDGKVEEVLDDHLSFLDVGIPSVDLIDLDYGPSNAWWHSPKDVLDNCSAASLGVAGRIVLEMLPDVEQKFRRM